MRIKNKHPERDIQQAIVSLIKIAFPHVLLFAVPNGGHRNIAEAIVLKRTGVVAGVGDLCLLWSPGRVGFIEVKSEKGSLTQSQEAFQKRCAEMGIPFAVVKSADAAYEAIKSWGVS